MKKILIIHHSGTIGGAGLSLLHIIRSIDRTKFHLAILCPSYPSELYELLEKEDCEVITSDTSPKIFAHYNGGIPCAFSYQAIKNYLDVLVDRNQIKKYITSIDPDIVVLNSMTLFWIGGIAKRMGKRTICFHRETYQRGVLGLRTAVIKKGLSRWFDKVAFISLYDFNITGSIRGEKKLIYDRVDTDLLTKFSKQEASRILSLDPNTKYILYLGGMSGLKGADVILKSMKYISEDNIKLIFINDTNGICKPSLRQCKTLKEKLKFFLKPGVRRRAAKIYFDRGLKDKVLFRARTTTPELYYQASDVVVFPSTKPHQARPIYEAGISRTPIIITDFKHTQEFARDGITAFTFKNSDSVDLADKIKLVLQGGEKVKQVLDNNLQQSLRNHDLQTLAKDLEALFNFEDVVKKGS